MPAVTETIQDKANNLLAEFEPIYGYQYYPYGKVVAGYEPRDDGYRLHNLFVLLSHIRFHIDAHTKNRVHDILYHIASGGSTEEMPYFEPASHPSNLISWLADGTWKRTDLVDRAIQDGATTLFEAIQRAQVLEFELLFNAVVRFLKN